MMLVLFTFKVDAKNICVVINNISNKGSLVDGQYNLKYMIYYVRNIFFLY